jgi:hypothetical protein
MKSTSIAKLAPVALVLGWLFTPSVGHAACATSVASLHGWYALLVSGNNLVDGSGKFLAGALFFNGAGGIAATHVYGSAGAVTSATGNYVANSDCTLTITLSVGSVAGQVYTVGITSTGNEAIGIEVDALAVATIDLQAQYAAFTTGTNFNAASLNGSYLANCSNGLNSDLNLAAFNNGSFSGTDPYNNGGGNFAVANVPYSGTYAINSDGTFSGSLVVLANPFDFYGVISAAGAKIEYFYTNVSGGLPTNAFASCTGALAFTGAVGTPGFSLAAAAGSVTITQGGNGSDAIAVAPVNGFSGTVTFGASGLPPGASAGFSPASSATGAALNLAVAASTVPGSYPVTITGTSGSTTASTTVTLVVSAAAPGFTLADSPSPITLIHGGVTGGVVQVAVTDRNGFNGTVSFSLTGMPANLDFVYLPSSSATHSQLVMYAPSTVRPGTYGLTVTGKSGSVVASVPLTLVIQ